jgi:hypothetical protein
MTDMATLEAQNLDACKQYRAYYDEVLCRHVGIQPPEPRAGEDVNHFRARSLNLFKRTFLPPVHDYHVGYHALSRADSTAFNWFEKQMLAACKVEANNPIHVPRGELRKIEERDALGQIRQIKWIGQECFVKQMGRPGRRAVIRTPDTAPGWFR